MEEHGKQDEGGVDNVRERCRWSGPLMALGHIPHDVPEQRGCGHLVGNLGLPRLLHFWLGVPLVSHINNTWSCGTSQRVEKIP